MRRFWMDPWSSATLRKNRAGKRGGDGEKLRGRAEGFAELRDNVPQRRRNSLSLRQPNSALAPSNGAGRQLLHSWTRETERDGGGREDGSEGVNGPISARHRPRENLNFAGRKFGAKVPGDSSRSGARARTQTKARRKIRNEQVRNDNERKKEESRWLELQARCD
ncbi:hypothetical protein AOLI_G00127210 [Acnodon oligacanthus]